MAELKIPSISLESIQLNLEEKLKNVEAESESILSEARQRALAREDRIVADARDEASKIIDNANREAALEKQKVVNEVKEEMVDIASAMAGKIVEASMNEAEQKRLSDETYEMQGLDIKDFVGTVLHWSNVIEVLDYEEYVEEYKTKHTIQEK